MLIKKSLAISGHRTSLALEPAFWQALAQAAHQEEKSTARLIAQIDKERNTGPHKNNLASAVRVWLLTRKTP